MNIKQQARTLPKANLIPQSTVNSGVMTFMVKHAGNVDPRGWAA